MNLQLLTLLLGLFTLPAELESPFSETLALAKKENKEILLVFTGSDWCNSCMHFQKQVLDNQDALQEIEQDYLIHLADFPRNGTLSKEKIKENNSLADTYNPEGAFPKILVIDHEQTITKRIDYFPGEEKEFLGAINN